MIRNQDCPFRKTIFDPPVGQLANLSAYTFISGNIDSSCCPPMRHREDKECHGFLGVSHVAVVRVAMDDVERKADILGYSDAGWRFRCHNGEERTEVDIMAYTKQQEQMYAARSSIRIMRVLAVGLGTDVLVKKVSSSRGVVDLGVVLMSVEPLALLSIGPSTLPLTLAFARFVDIVEEIER